MIIKFSQSDFLIKFIQFSIIYLTAVVSFFGEGVYNYIILLSFYIVLFFMNKVKFKTRDFFAPIILGMVFLISSYSNNIFQFHTILIFMSNFLLFFYLLPRIKLAQDDLITILNIVLVIAVFYSFSNILINLERIININSLNKYIDISLSSFFNNRNMFGFFLYIAITINYMKIKLNASKKYYFYFILLFINLILTFSRNALISTFICIFIFELLLLIRYNIKISKFVLYAILIFGVILIGQSMFLEVLRDGLFRFDSGTSGRFNMWNHALKNVIPKKILFGYGISQAPKINPRNLNYHNTFINLIVETGVSSFVIYLIIHIYIFIISFKYCLKDKFNMFLFSFYVSYLFYFNFENALVFSPGYLGFISTLLVIFMIRTSYLTNKGASYEIRNFDVYNE